MPKNVQQPGCALREELKKSGDIMDLQVVLAECKAIVHDYESSSAAGAHASINPSDFPGIACESLASLCAVTGMGFAVKPNNSSYAAGYSSYGAYGCSGSGHHAAVAGSQQWCSDCGLDGTHLVKGWAKRQAVLARPAQGEKRPAQRLGRQGPARRHHQGPRRQRPQARHLGLQAHPANR